MNGTDALCRRSEKPPMSALFKQLVDLFGVPDKTYKVRHSSLDSFGSACSLGSTSYSLFVSGRIPDEQVLDMVVSHVVRALTEADKTFVSLVQDVGALPLDADDLLETKPATYFALFEISAGSTPAKKRHIVLHTDAGAFFKQTMINAVDAAQREIEKIAKPT
jgi:hypothetical protein